MDSIKKNFNPPNWTEVLTLDSLMNNIHLARTEHQWITFIALVIITECTTAILALIAIGSTLWKAGRQFFTCHFTEAWTNLKQGARAEGYLLTTLIVFPFLSISAICLPKLLPQPKAPIIPIVPIAPTPSVVTDLNLANILPVDTEPSQIIEELSRSADILLSELNEVRARNTELLQDARIAAEALIGQPLQYEIALLKDRISALESENAELRTRPAFSFPSPAMEFFKFMATKLDQAKSISGSHIRLAPQDYQKFLEILPALKAQGIF